MCRILQMLENVRGLVNDWVLSYMCGKMVARFTDVTGIINYAYSWKLVEVWSKRGSYLLNTKCNNVQNLADAWKCERPCQWLSALLHVWKNGGTFHRCNRHYKLRIQTCKPHMNGAHQGQGHRQLLMNMRFAVIFVLLCIPLQCGLLCRSRKNSSFAKLFAKKYSVSRSD